MADFTIKSLNGQEFRVHKAILSARIPAFFRPMFNSNMKETTTSGMKLDLDREIVSALLQFVYSDNVSNLPAIAIRLFPIAHQYQLHRLTALCISELCENITVENIPMVSVFADRYSSKPLQSACQEFIEEHKGELAKMFARSLHISQ